MVTAFIDKDWLVIPINDGYPMGIINTPDSRAIHSTLQNLAYKPNEPPGTHWTLTVVDVRVTPAAQMKAYYYDSLAKRPDKRNRGQVIAYFILWGLHEMFNQKNPSGREVFTKRAVPHVVMNMPNQNKKDHNSCTEDAGACGPFTILMAKEVTQYLLRYHQAYNVWPPNLRLPETFPQDLQWDSRHTRATIKELVEREIRVSRYLNDGVKDWFESARVRGMGGRSGWKRGEWGWSGFGMRGKGYRWRRRCGKCGPLGRNNHVY
jgi:hypothetical protein